MKSPLQTDALKSALRKKMRARRRILALKTPTPDLRPGFEDLAQDILTSDIIAGFSPIGEEIDTWPLLQTLHGEGRRIALPVVMGIDQPLLFHEWTPNCEMETDRYGVSFPMAGERLSPHLILVPLLAFTASGDRLGYGGGYYDRTLETLRQESEVFACGVAYAGQEVETLPTDAYDAKLDGILTEFGFRVTS